LDVDSSPERHNSGRSRNGVAVIESSPLKASLKEGVPSRRGMPAVVVAS
jgi:hypothetical protein